ncbi:LysR family transcriptional regulator [Aliidongia dinghuensis]|uniref:LysR family transcriptional regulator n=1 Tax=Aliidongia dinghuensis TaxID=1867774 RepID=A0A8J2YRG4_9PROT|nr:LysR family transcriptional regulator [Aliidongia dinghuensis]GGF09677.1 LysR family transcriptional regulator [Aliidongia dinghuensis]
MNLRALDLNLLVVFDAVMTDRSVTKAAVRLNMAQPALSHALTRLRQALQDELFVRTPDGMAPTPKAESLAEGVREALDGLRTALDSAEPFDPTTADRQFAIAVNNHAAIVLAAPLATAAAAEAPSVVLDFRPSGTLDLADRLDRGMLDLAIGGTAAPGDRFADLRLFHDRFAVLMRRGHAAANAGALTLAAFAALPHLMITSSGERVDFVDEALAAAGLARRIALRAPLLATPAALLQSDMIAVVSERAAQEFARTAPLATVPLPFESPVLTTAMLWHRRVGAVPAHRWLRDLVLRVARTAG